MPGRCHKDRREGGAVPPDAEEEHHGATGRSDGVDMQIIDCNDRTCRHNDNGICQCQIVQIDVDKAGVNRVVNVCRSYEENDDGTD